jgi:two-component system phosphate regulon sensor histidine kinase PhoR
MGNELGGIIAGVPIPVVLVGADDRVEEANPAALALFGASLIGRHHVLTFRQPEVVEAVAVGRTGQPARARMVVQGETQDRVHEVTVTPVGDRLVLSFEDQSALEQMDQMRRDFVANVSHELRTPLTAMIGFIETLQGPAKNDTRARERFLGIMAREAERMNRLVRDLLQLSRVEAEERVRPSQEVDMAGLIRSAAAMLKSVAEEGRVSIRIEGADHPAPLRADSDQMMQVLSNLIENAIKYGSPAGAEVVVRLARETGPRGPLLRLSVSDSGEGIETQHLPRLTERFYRVDSHRSREKGGTGLGLAIVKHIISRHRGRLIIESEKGKGSRFSMLLPLD